MSPVDPSILDRAQEYLDRQTTRVEIGGSPMLARRRAAPLGARRTPIGSAIEAPEPVEPSRQLAPRRLAELRTAPLAEDLRPLGPAVGAEEPDPGRRRRPPGPTPIPIFDRSGRVLARPAEVAARPVPTRLPTPEEDRQRSAWERRLAEDPALAERVRVRETRERAIEAEFERRRALEDALKLTAADALREASVTRAIPFVGGVVKGIDVARLYLAAKAVEQGTVSEAQEAMLIDFGERAAERARRGETIGYKVVEILTQLPAFAGEIVLTGGVYTAGRQAMIEGIEAAAKRLALKRLERAAAEVAAGKAAKRGALAAAERAAVRVAGTAAGAVAQTAAMPPRVFNSVLRRMIPEIELSEDQSGQLHAAVTGPGESFHEAMVKGFGDAWVEVFSERTGGAIAAIGATRAMQGLKLAVMSRWLKAQPGRTVDDLLQAIKSKTAWHGILGEMFEERVGEALRPALGIEARYQPPSLDQLAAEAIAFAVPSAAAAAIRTVSPRVRRQPAGPSTEPGTTTAEQSERLAELGMTPAQIAEESAASAARLMALAESAAGTAGGLEPSGARTRTVTVAGPEGAVPGVTAPAEEAGEELRTVSLSRPLAETSRAGLEDLARTRRARLAREGLSQAERADHEADLATLAAETEGRERPTSAIQEPVSVAEPTPEPSVERKPRGEAVTGLAEIVQPIATAWERGPDEAGRVRSEKFAEARAVDPAGGALPEGVRWIGWQETGQGYAAPLFQDDAVSGSSFMVARGQTFADRLSSVRGEEVSPGAGQEPSAAWIHGAQPVEAGAGAIGEPRQAAGAAVGGAGVPGREPGREGQRPAEAQGEISEDTLIAELDRRLGNSLASLEAYDQEDARDSGVGVIMDRFRFQENEPADILNKAVRAVQSRVAELEEERQIEQEKEDAIAERDAYANHREAVGREVLTFLESHGMQVVSDRGYDLVGASRYIRFRSPHDAFDETYSIRISDHEQPEGGGFIRTPEGISEGERAGESDFHVLIPDKEAAFDSGDLAAQMREAGLDIDPEVVRKSKLSGAEGPSARIAAQIHSPGATPPLSEQAAKREPEPSAGESRTTGRPTPGATGTPLEGVSVFPEVRAEVAAARAAPASREQLEGMRRSELRNLAALADVPEWRRMRRGELIEALDAMRTAKGPKPKSGALTTESGAGPISSAFQSTPAGGGRQAESGPLRQSSQDLSERAGTLIERARDLDLSDVDEGFTRMIETTRQERRASNVPPEIKSRYDIVGYNDYQENADIEEAITRNGSTIVSRRTLEAAWINPTSDTMGEVEELAYRKPDGETRYAYVINTMIDVDAPAQASLVTNKELTDNEFFNAWRSIQARSEEQFKNLGKTIVRQNEEFPSGWRQLILGSRVSRKQREAIKSASIKLALGIEPSTEELWRATAGGQSREDVIAHRKSLQWNEESIDRDLKSLEADIDERRPSLKRLGNNILAKLESQAPKNVPDMFEGARPAGRAEAEPESVTAAKRRLAAFFRGERLGVGMPLDVAADMMVVGAHYVRRGFRTFSAWSERMIADFGERVRPHLQELWARVQTLAGAEAGGERVTTPRREDVERYLAARGRDVDSPERVTWDANLRDAIGQKLPDRGRELVLEVLQEGRPYTATESAGIVHYMVGLQQREADAFRRASDPQSDAGARQTALAEAARLEMEIEDAYRALLASGTERGRALASQRFALNQRFERVALLARARNKKGAELAPAERERIEALGREIERLNGELEVARVKLEERQARAAIGARQRRGGRRGERMTAEQAQAAYEAQVAKARELLRAGCGLN